MNIYEWVVAGIGICEDNITKINKEKVIRTVVCLHNNKMLGYDLEDLALELAKQMIADGDIVVERSGDDTRTDFEIFFDSYLNGIGLDLCGMLVRIFKEDTEYDVIEYLDDEERIFGQTVALIARTDRKNRLEVGETGDNGNKSYLFYRKRFSWEEKDGDPKTLAEVHGLIVNAVRMISDMTPEEIEEQINDSLCEIGRSEEH